MAGRARYEEGARESELDYRAAEREREIQDASLCAISVT